MGIRDRLDTGDVLRLSIGEREYRVTTPVAIMGIMAGCIGLWVLVLLVKLALALVSFVSGDETAISRFFDRNRERRGFDALARGMVAIAVGEGREATSNATRAERDLKRPELTNLINAQAAELRGDRNRAQTYYKRMLEIDQTRVIGVRGLMKQKLEDGDDQTALTLAEKALELRPRHEETMTTLLSLQLKLEDWSGARKTLQLQRKAGMITRGIARRREAIVSLADAREQLDSGNISQGARLAADANRLSPTLIPAAVLAAELEAGKGKRRRAEAIIRKAWAAKPHPDLSVGFAEIVSDETPEARLKRFGSLLQLNPSFDDTRLLKAELLLAVDDIDGARETMGTIAEDRPTVRSLTLMAAIYRAEGADDRIVRGWLNRALSAPRGPEWVCENCDHVQPGWAAVCVNCQAFDRFTWEDSRESGETRDRVPMLGFVAGLIAGDRKRDDPVAKD